MFRYPYFYEVLWKFLSLNRLHDLGLRQHDKASLLVELLIPTVFSIVLVIQLHFFHKPLTMKINRIIINRKQIKQQELLNASIQGSSEEAPAATSSKRPEVVLPDTSRSDSDQETDQIDGESTGLAKFLWLYKSASRVLWRIAEIHALKIVCFVVMLVVVQQVSISGSKVSYLCQILMPLSFQILSK